MFGSNEVTETALISDHPIGKSVKTDSAIVDSGFISCEILSENLSSELFDQIPPQTEPSAEISTDKLAEMRVDSGFCSVSENFSKLKVVDPTTNDLSATNKGETARRVSYVTKDHCKYYVQDEDGDTYLHAAIVEHHPEITLALIRGAPTPDCLDFENDDGFTPLHLAVATDQWQVVRWLIVAGAQPSPRNFRGESPLHMAARLGSMNCCRAITDPVSRDEREFLNVKYPVTGTKPVDLDQWDYDGQTCIHVAALNGHIDVLRLLIWHGANVNAREGRSGYTALHYAVEKRNERLAYFLLTECKKLNAEITTYAGRSALQLGLPVNRGLMNALLSRGAASPYPSDDESLEDSEEEMIFDNKPIYMPQLVNGCA